MVFFSRREPKEKTSNCKFICLLSFYSYVSVREPTELDFNFTQSPGQSLKMGKSNIALNDYRKSLPIYNYKQIILSYLTENKVVIIHGGVASGKSTQVDVTELSVFLLFFF